MMAQWMRVSLRDVVFAHLRRLRHIVTKLLQVWIKLYFPLTTTELGAPEQNMRKHFHSTHKVKNKPKQLSRFDKLFWTALSSLVFAKHIQTVSKDTSQVFSKGGNNSGNWYHDLMVSKYDSGNARNICGFVKSCNNGGTSASCSTKDSSRLSQSSWHTLTV